MDMLEALRREDRTLIERACEARATAVYVGDKRLLCRVLTKYLMYVAADDTSLTPHLAMSGYWEMWVTQAMARNVRPGWRCFDVGANVGYFTLLLADLVGEHGNVVACEPQPRLAAMVEASVGANGCAARSVVVCAALNDRVGSVALHVPAANLGSASIMGLTVPSEKITVECSTLDSLGGIGGKVDFVKVDAEGAEAAILRGAERTLARDRPVLLLEFSRGSAQGTGHIRRLIEGGYGLQIVDTAGRLVDETPEALEQLGERELAMLWLSPKS